MDKKSPCYGCEKRWAENGDTCHSSCERYKEYHDKRVTRTEMIRKKKASEAMIDNVRFETMNKVKRVKKIQTAWKGKGMREKIVILTRDEIDALTKHDNQIKREKIKAIFDDVKELLELRYRFEDKRGGICEDEYDRCRHFYGRNVCESLLIDLQHIERKYTDETN
jgi:hypothetical protein